MAGVVSAILRLKKEEEVGQRGCRGADSFSNTLEAVGLANCEEARRSINQCVALEKLQSVGQC